MKIELCPECSNGLVIYKILDETTAIMKCKYCQKAFKFSYDEKTHPSNINNFNLGAFFFSGLWGFWNGTSGYACLCLFLGIISGITPLALYLSPIVLITSLYNGFTGNRRSWLKKKWTSIENFEKSQTLWSQAAVLALIFSIIIFAAQIENFNK